MTMHDYTHTSVSVTEGHPDKLCDRISDAIVESLNRLDPEAQAEVECAVATGVLFVACHASTDLRIDVAEIARDVITDAGYSGGDFNPRTVPVMTSIGRLPPHRTQRRGAPERLADHNVTTFGYATDQTSSRLPLPVELAHRLARRLSELRRGEAEPWIGPDAQAQVTVRFEARRPVEVEAITLLAGDLAGREAITGEFADGLYAVAVTPVLEAVGLPLLPRVRVFVNPGEQRGDWGPAHHSGVTGRKIGVDTYGDYSRQPSSALSGKSPDRIDRVATYAARHAAKNVVASGLAAECEVQLSYTIGRGDPASVEVDTFGSGRIPDRVIRDRVREWLDLRPAAVVAAFGTAGADGGTLPFRELAVFGHVGRTDVDVPWERTDRAADLLG
jgi:S-adenosylmethionine synthetase